MAITHSTAAKQASTNAVVDLLDAGTANLGATLRLRDSTTVIVELIMDDPAFGAADGSGDATAAAISPDDAVASGDVDNFQCLDRDETLVFSGTVGESVSVTGVNTGSKTFTVAEDYSFLAAGDRIRISGSTGNDGFYTVVSVSGSGPTTITVVETPASAVADGLVHAFDLTIQNTSVNIGQTVSVSSFVYNAGEQ